MPALPTRRLLGAAALLLGLAACGGADHTAMPGAGHGGATTLPGTAGHGSMAALNEIQFIDGMIVHHQGAIAMANEALTEAERPEIRQLAQAIVGAQGPEISQLQGWRAQWHAGAPATDPALLDAMGMGHMAVSPDPAKPFDQRFLEAMISHHQGAVAMANALQATHPELKAFAAKVVADQTAEIEQMQQWLREWYGE